MKTVYCICLICFVLFYITGANIVNVALNKSAVQSSTLNGFTANQAVDGIINSGGNFAHSLITTWQWWRVDLQNSFYISHVVIYNRADCCQHRLRDIYILTSSSTSSNPAEPASPGPGLRNTDIWRQRRYISGTLNRVSQTIQLSLMEPIRHLAIICSASEGITLREVQVFGTRVVMAIPRGSLSVVGSSPSCVSISWSPAPAASIYKIRCTNKDDMHSSTTTISHICGYQPYTLVSCSVQPLISQSSSGNSEYVTAQSRTECTPPTTPGFTVRDMVVAPGVPESLATRSLAVNIQDNSQPNCEYIKLYTVKLYLANDADHTDIKTTRSHGETVYFTEIEAITNYTVTVVAHNNHDMVSEAGSFDIKTGELGSGPVEELEMVATSSSCMNLTWKAPLKPNGVMVSYRIICGTLSHPTRVAIDVTQFETCGLEPYGWQNCSVTPINTFSDGVVSTVDGRTDCSDPGIAHLVATQSQHRVDDHPRRMATITWSASTPNCAYVKEYNITLLWLNGEELELVNTFTTRSSGTPRVEPVRSARFENLTAWQTYVMQLTIKNDLGLISNTSGYFRTNPLLPYKDPSNYKIRTNATCAKMTWIGPEDPNGDISQYEYLCQYGAGSVKTGNFTSDIDFFETHTHALHSDAACGFPSESYVNCSLRAFNQAGPSGYAYQDYYTKFDYTEISPPVVQLVPAFNSTTHAKLLFQFHPVLIHHMRIQPEYYRVIVEEVVDDGPTKVDETQLLNSGFAKNKGITYYVAAKLQFDEENRLIDFLCGDSRWYGGYYNAPLKRGVRYRIHYSFNVMHGDIDIVHVSINQADPVLVPLDTPTTKAEIPTTTADITVISTVMPTTKPTTTQATTTTPTPIAYTSSTTLPQYETSTPLATMNDDSDHTPLAPINDDNDNTTSMAFNQTTSPIPIIDQNATAVDEKLQKDDRLVPQNGTDSNVTMTDSVETTPAPVQENNTSIAGLNVTNFVPSHKSTEVTSQITNASEPHSTSTTIASKPTITTLRPVTTLVTTSPTPQIDRSLEYMVCPDPEIMEHAEYHDNLKRSFKAEIVYHCEDGYTFAQPDVRLVTLTCGQSDHDPGQLDWIGDKFHCIPGKKSTPQAAGSRAGSYPDRVVLAVVLVTVALIVVIGIVAFILIRRRKRKYAFDHNALMTSSPTSTLTSVKSVRMNQRYSDLQRKDRVYQETTTAETNSLASSEDFDNGSMSTRCTRLLQDEDSDN